VDPRSRHLLLVAGGLGIADVRLLVDEALRDGRQVVLLYGCRDASEVYPSSLLPDEVEYLVATDDGSVATRALSRILVLVYEAWADQAFACGPLPMLRTLAGLVAGRTGRLGVATLGRKRGGGRPVPPGSPTARRRSFPPGRDGAELGCAVGACLGCVIWAWTGRNACAAKAPCSPSTRSTGTRRPGRDPRAVRAKKRVVTQGRAAPPAGVRRPVPAPSTRRTPTVRTIRSAIVEPRPAARRVPAPVAAPPPALASAGPAADLSVDLGRGLCLAQPAAGRLGTFGYGVEYADVVDIERLGAICCKGTTLRPRQGKTARRGSPRSRPGCSTPSACRIPASTPSRALRGPVGRRQSGDRQRRRGIDRGLTFQVVRKLDLVPGSPGWS